MTLLAPAMFLILGLTGCIKACASDLWCRKVFNCDILLVVVGAAGWVATTAPSTMPTRLLVATGVMSAGTLLWLSGWLGGGDAKLLAAGAIWTGPDATFHFLIATALAGGLLTATIILARHRLHRQVAERPSHARAGPRTSPSASCAMPDPGSRRSETVPYAPAIVAGLVLSMVDKVI